MATGFVGKILGRKVRVLPTPLGYQEAKKEYGGWYAIVVDPLLQGNEVIAGEVAAVSRSEDGVSRLMRRLLPDDRIVMVTRLA